MHLEVLKQANASEDACRKFSACLREGLFATLPKAKSKDVESSSSSVNQEDLDVDLPVHRRRSRRQRYVEGWRAGAAASCITALAVLIINATVMTWAASQYPSAEGIGTIFSGHCARAKSMNSWLQLVVNVLSSTLLAASNYCMQCLGSPTREEVDTAHGKGKLLDIGIPSIQNLKAISLERRILWAGLALSALPLHFVYNSMLFLTTQANTYSVAPVDQGFLTTGVYNLTLLNDSTIVNVKNLLDTANNILLESYQAGRFETLTPRECFEAYHTQYVASRGDVLLVQNQAVSPTEILIDPNGADSLEYLYSYYPYSSDQAATDQTDLQPIFKELPFPSEPSRYPSYDWQCSPRINKTCTLDRPIQNKTFSWLPYGNEVQYCLSEKVHEECKLNYSLQFAVIVVVSNLAKVICMFLTLWRHDRSALITIGDAIQSFLDRPDYHTRDFCVYSDRNIQLLIPWQKDAEHGKPISTISGFDAMINRAREAYMKNPKLKQWRPGLRRWWSAVPIIRWGMCITLYIVLLMIATILYFSALHGRSANWSSLRDFGIGNPVGNNILSMGNSMLVTVIIANIPQVILSYVYILFNSLYTCMVAGHEWTQFAKHRKTLRSLFVVKIDVLDHNGSSRTRAVQADISILSCGFSPGAIVLAIIVGTFIMLGAVLLGLRKYTSEMPIAATCSAVISAACHALEDDSDAAVLPIQWGVASKNGKIGHCCFSSKLVAPPIPGHMYA
ncbi:MAG: hypothetical protein Q9225_000612 [Loekoesia sp. 1 TL-2023]